MAWTWLSIRVDLVAGRGEHLWPRPGRIFAAARGHTFAALADAIDVAFARWDHSHLQEFTLADNTRLRMPDPDWQIEGEIEKDFRRVRLSRLRPGEQFSYVFDLGDYWTHLCTVGSRSIDPLETLGIQPDKPMPYWGWGDIPDQYRRRWEDDDGGSPMPADPGLTDLPHLQPFWGPDGAPPEARSLEQRNIGCGNSLSDSQTACSTSPPYTSGCSGWNRSARRSNSWNPSSASCWLCSA